MSEMEQLAGSSPAEAAERIDLRSPSASDPIGWSTVCPLERIPLDRGVAALVDGHQVAVFRLADPSSGPDELHAVDHRDPATGTPTMARGLVGSTGDQVVLAAPLHKERYDLVTGRCLDREDLRLAVHEVRLHGTDVQVRTNVTPPKSAGNINPPES